jgi:antitoxin CptB
MSDGRDRERIRWHCRRGMLELDLVLCRFMERHFDGLGPEAIEAFASLLARTDPELLDLVMGHDEASVPGERDVLSLIRNDSFDKSRSSISTIS